MARMFEIAFQLAGRVNPSFNSTFQGANRRLEQLEGNSTSMGGKLGLALGGAALAAGGLAVAIGGLATSLGDDLQGVLNGIQASTGSADSAMGDMRDTILDIYNNNLGENFEDIGAAMTVVAQQTGFAGDALQGTTEDGLMLRDTLGMEVNESIRTVDMMMKKFGISSDEAFNLIAQGAQSGLDKNGNLLDSINEYSVHFEQLGLDSEEMMNMMANGAAAGVYDIDKLGDAMKEFGIRSKDGSKASTEAFESLGLNAKGMSSAFAQGGDTAKEAFDKTTKALFAMKNPLEKEAAGVALFGTMWEDVGTKGMEALVNTQGSIDNTKDALGEINDVKYDTFGLAVRGIKRNLETGILIPIGEKILPQMNEFAGWITDNMPAIQNEISYAMDIAGSAITKVGTAITDTKTFFEDHWNVVSPIIAGIGAGAITFGTITLATKAWTAATKLATLSQTALSVAMNLSPMGKVIGLVSLLVAGGVALYQNWDTVKEKADEVWVGIKNTFANGANVVIDILNKVRGAMGKPMIARVEMSYYKNASNATTMDDRLGNAGYEKEHAWGGIMTSPHIGLVAEAGPEAIVPLSNRSRGIDVWRQAGQALGVGGGPTQPNVTFAPVIHVSAGDGSNKQEIEDIVKRAVSEAQSNFNQWAQNYQKEQRRVAYG